MKTTFNLVSLGVFLISAIHAKAESFLVKDGRPNAEIIIAEDAPRPTELAAEELQTYVEKMTGARP